MKSEVAIGVLCLDFGTERVKFQEDTPGCLRNDETVDFRVKREIVREATPARFFPEGCFKEDPELLPYFIEAAKNLEARGVKAIAGDCGFMAIYQQDVARAVSVPVIASSLIMVPLVYRMLAENKKVGILTPHPELGERQFNAVGWSGKDIPVTVKECIMTEEGLVKAAKELVQENPDVGAIVAECAITPPYSHAIQKATGLPVFDIATLVKMVHAAVDPPDYSRE